MDQDAKWVFGAIITVAFIICVGVLIHAKIDSDTQIEMAKQGYEQELENFRPIWKKKFNVTTKDVTPKGESEK